MKKLIIITGVCLFLISCANHKEENTEEIVPACNPDISFQNDVNPILVANCLSCHSGSQFPDLRTYESIAENAALIKEQVVSRNMPIGGSLSVNEIELISCWVQNGSPNN